MKKILSITAMVLAGISVAAAQGTPNPAGSGNGKPTPTNTNAPAGNPVGKPAAKPTVTVAPAGKPSNKPTAKPAITTAPAGKPAPGVTTSKPAVVSGPSIAFAKKEHDFGKIIMGPKASVVFTFTNNGNEPVVLTDVKASCGCTTPKWPTEPIAPGATAQIEAVYDTNGRPGYFEKTITVFYAGKTEELKIKGNVENQGTDRPGNGQL
jgi:hypothetical protein